MIGPEKDHHKLLYLSQVPMVCISDGKVCFIQILFILALFRKKKTRFLNSFTESRSMFYESLQITKILFLVVKNFVFEIYLVVKVS